jgi:hypothetical protein
VLDDELFMALMPGDRYFAFSFMEAIASKSKAFVRFFGAFVSPRGAVGILVFFDRWNPFSLDSAQAFLSSFRTASFSLAPLRFQAHRV